MVWPLTCIITVFSNPSFSALFRHNFVTWQSAVSKQECHRRLITNLISYLFFSPHLGYVISRKFGVLKGLWHFFVLVDKIIRLLHQPLYSTFSCHTSGQQLADWSVKRYWLVVVLETNSHLGYGQCRIWPSNYRGSNKMPEVEEHSVFVLTPACSLRLYSTVPRLVTFP